MIRRLRWTLLGISLAAGVAATGVAATPLPTVEGPIAVTAASGEPFRGANEQPVAGPGLPLPVLQPFGYVEEEYFVSGTVDGRPYKTALLVRKPRDAKKFSGVVAVETLHAQGAIPFWGLHDVMMPYGHAWAMVVSQRSALEMFLKKGNATRYGTLDIPLAAGPAQNMLAAGAQDTISQDILTQVGALLKSPVAGGPFAGLKVKYLIMGGSSQTGGTTLRYIQQSHARARMPDGRPVYDGYLPSEAFTSGALSGGDAAVIHVVGEGDFSLFRSIARGFDITLRGDSDAPNDRFREYQFPAASHVPTRGISDPLAIFPTLSGVMQPGEKLSQFPSPPFYQMAFVNLVQWVTKGVKPPHAAPLEMVNGEILRDEHGNARGGVRTPWVDLPTARYTASAPLPAGSNNMFRRMIGLQEPFPADKLHALYGTRTDYLKRFDREIDRLVKERWLLRADGEKLKADERKNPPL